MRKIAHSRRFIKKAGIDRVRSIALKLKEALEALQNEATELELESNSLHDELSNKTGEEKEIWESDGNHPDDFNDRSNPGHSFERQEDAARILALYCGDAVGAAGDVISDLEQMLDGLEDGEDSYLED